MTTFPIDDPDALRDLLLGIDWGTSVIDGHVAFRFCPMCHAAIVPEFANTTTTTPRLEHIGYHVALATVLQQQATP